MAIRKIVSRSIGVDVIAAEDLADNSVTVAEIADDAVTSAKIDSTSTGMSLADLAVDTDTLYVDASNNRVGVGTSSPDYPIHSEGSGFNGGRIGIESTDSGTSLEIKGVNGAAINDVAFISLVDGTNDSFIGLTGTNATAGAIRIAPGNSEKVRIDSDGLKFNGDTAAANALDDYEEGTYYPTLTAGSNTALGTSVLTDFRARYVKIGRNVWVEGYCRFDTSGFTGSWGDTRISLPFTAGNQNSEQFGPINISYISNVFQNVPADHMVGGYVYSGNSYFNLTLNQKDGTEKTISQTYLKLVSSLGIMFSCHYSTENAS